MGNKGKKVSTLARSLTRSSFQRQRAAILLPRYLVWIKSYLFVYVSLSAVCTPSRRCTTVQRICACMCSHVFHTYTYPFPSLYLSLPLLLLCFSLSVLPLAISVSLFRPRRCSCIVSDKQPHVHTITACEWIHFADTRRGSRIVITAQKASKPSYRESFIILDGTEKGSKRVHLILGKLKPAFMLNVNCTTVKGDNEFYVNVESSPLKLSESFSHYRTCTICMKLTYCMYYDIISTITHAPPYACLVRIIYRIAVWYVHDVRIRVRLTNIQPVYRDEHLYRDMKRNGKGQEGSSTKRTKT